MDCPPSSSMSENDLAEGNPDEDLPPGTLEWGQKLVQLMQEGSRSLSHQLHMVESEGKKNKKDVQRIEQKLAKVEKRNESLEVENTMLKEKLLDLEYQQKHNNLIFEGIQDSQEESDLQCINKLRAILQVIPGIDVTKFRIDCCHRIDGKFSPSSTRRIMCSFNWYYDVQCILRHRKMLPKGIYVSEDLPVESIDRRKVLKPIYNAAHRMDSLKQSTKMSKDKLIINGKVYSAAPRNNLGEVSALLNIQSTCQRSNESTTIFLGSHSPFSNLYGCNFYVENIQYNSVEQYIQSQKASLFDDDTTHSRIRSESNPYVIKKLGSRVKNFSAERWRSVNKDIACKAVRAKFAQNLTLKQILLDSGNVMLAESSTDPFWGTGIHLHDKVALDKRCWKNPQGGAMCEILQKVRQDLRQQWWSDPVPHISCFPMKTAQMVTNMFMYMYILCYVCSIMSSLIIPQNATLVNINMITVSVRVQQRCPVQFKVKLEFESRVRPKGKLPCSPKPYNGQFWTI